MKSRKEMRSKALAALAAGLLLSLPVLGLGSDGKGASAGPADMRRHPIYSTYQFPEAEKAVRIGIQPLWIFHANIAEIMKRDHILRRELKSLGLDVHFFPFLKGADLNWFAREGDLDAGAGGDMATLSAAASFRLVVPSLADQGFIDLIARRFMMVKDLKGKRIGYPHGSDAHFNLLEALDSEGIRPDQAELIRMDANEMPDAMRKGRIDACVAWEPVTSVIQGANPESVIIHQGRYLGFLYFTKAFAERRPEAALQVLASSVRAFRWMKKSRANLLLSCTWVAEAGQKLAGGAYEVSPELMAGRISKEGKLHHSFLLSESLFRKFGQLPREFEFLQGMGLLPATVEWEFLRQVFDRRLLEKVLFNSEGYRLNEFDYAINTGN